MRSARRLPLLIALLAVSLAGAFLVTACLAGPRPKVSVSALAPAVDTRDPESVLRAYYSAWAQGDWSRQRSFMSSNYANMQREPVESLRVLKVKLVRSANTSALYDVRFQITVRGQGVSMTSGTYGWSYELTWDAQRTSWIITNYGAG